MRPMPQWSGAYPSSTFSDAFQPFPNIDLKAVDTAYRERTFEYLVDPSIGVNPSPAYGTFIDLQKTRYGVNVFFKTAPQAPLPLTPTLKKYSGQIQNPTIMDKQPGFTSNLTIVPTEISALVNKGYSGVPNAGSV